MELKREEPHYIIQCNSSQFISKIISVLCHTLRYTALVLALSAFLIGNGCNFQNGLALKTKPQT